MKTAVKFALAVYFLFQIYVLVDLRGDFRHLTLLHLLRPGAILVCAVLYLRGNQSQALLLSIWAGSGIVRLLWAPPIDWIGYGECVTQFLLSVAALLAWRGSRPVAIQPNGFQPDFPIVPLFSLEEEARRLLGQHGPVSEEEPDTDHAIAQKILVAETAETRIAIGIWNGRVRFANYRSSRSNDTDEAKGEKLAWFVAHYGGPREFDPPQDTGHMIFWRNRHRRITIVFGLLLGPVRIIDQDPDHWPDT